MVGRRDSTDNRDEAEAKLSEPQNLADKKDEAETVYLKVKRICSIQTICCICGSDKIQHHGF